VCPFFLLSRSLSLYTKKAIHAWLFRERERESARGSERARSLAPSFSSRVTFNFLNFLVSHASEVVRHVSMRHVKDTHCNTMQHTATHCNTVWDLYALQHDAAHCNTLQHTATRCNTLQHTATHSCGNMLVCAWEGEGERKQEKERGRVSHVSFMIFSFEGSFTFFIYIQHETKTRTRARAREGHRESERARER